MPQLFQRRMWQPNILSLNPFAFATPYTVERCIIPSRAAQAVEKARNLKMTATKEEREGENWGGGEHASEKAAPPF